MGLFSSDPADRVCGIAIDDDWTGETVVAVLVVAVL